MGRIFNRALGAVSYRLHVAAANAWRDNYNPLRSLTITRAVHLLEEGERGAYADLQWTYRYIEMQDATLGALIERRTSAIQKLDWGIKVREDVPDEKKGVAARQEAALKAAYERIGNLSAALEFLALASFRGFSHLEKVMDGEGRIIELAPVDQWFWCREGLYGQWTHNPDAKFGVNRGTQVPLPRFIIREVSRPVNRVALIAFVRKGLSQKDWDGFIEAYGIPAVFIIMPENIPADKTEEYLDAADQVTSDARGVLPGGSEIKTVDNGARGNNPFKEHLQYQDEQMVLRGTGGLLTMLTQSGSGTLAGGAHSNTFDEIAQAEAAEISEILQKQLDAEILETVTPGEQAWAYFELAANEETDTSAIVKDAAYLSRSGLHLDPAWIEEKTGYKVTAGAPAGGRLEAILNRAGGGADKPAAKEWKRFARETGTLGIPREVMPQIQQGNRAAMINFLRARGVDYVKADAKPADLKPTQAEYSPAKVAKAKAFQGSPRALLISSDNHVVDGHHQYKAALEMAPNEPIPVMRLKSPIMHILGLLLMMPSTSRAAGITNRADADEPAEPDALMQALRTAHARDMQPLGDALWSVYHAGDHAAVQAAVRKLGGELGGYIPAPEMEALLATEMTSAFLGDDEPDEEGIRNSDIIRWVTKAGRRFPIREGRGKSDADHFGPRSRPEMTQDEAEERLGRVVEHALKKRTSMHGAAYREGLGRIDLAWGTPGDKSDDFKGGSGLSHIVAKHGEADARKLPGVLAHGEIKAHTGSRGEAGDPLKRQIETDDYIAILAKEQPSRAWVVTGFTKR